MVLKPSNMAPIVAI